MILKVVDVKDPILRQVTKPVTHVDKKIQKLIADMWDTLSSQKDPEGVGLAAPQVGKSLKIFIMNYKTTKKTIINPEILEISEAKSKKLIPKSKKDILEGCLSLPHYYGPIKRATKVKIAYINEHGHKLIAEFEGFVAQIVQHEIDHLNGILFVDRILEQDAPLYKFHDDDWEEVELR